MIDAVYFEYCPGHLKRANFEGDPIDLLMRYGYEVFHFRPNDTEVRECPTHEIGEAKRLIHLSEVRTPLETSITDLIALRRGSARPLL